jgi:hypothetical protein
MFAGTVYKVPRVEVASAEVYFLTILEAKGLRFRFEEGWFLLRPFYLAVSVFKFPFLLRILVKVE